MTKFETPEIKVTMFLTEEAITTSSGYEQNQTGSKIEDWAYNTVQGGSDGDFPL